MVVVVDGELKKAAERQELKLILNAMLRRIKRRRGRAAGRVLMWTLQVVSRAARCCGAINNQLSWRKRVV